MYYPDLTKYEYATRYPGRKVLNVGWLDAPNPFPKGDEPGLAERLVLYAGHSIEHMMGSHECSFCGELSPSLKCSEKSVLMGCSEIRVLIDDVWYASPTMVVHYVDAHGYRPPMDFIRACFYGADPTSQEYSDALYELQRSVGPDRFSHAEISAVLGSQKFGTKPPPEVAAKMKERGY